MAEREGEISEALRNLVFSSDLARLREIAQNVLREIKSFEQMANEGMTKLNFKEQLAEFERLLIRDALERTGGNQRRAARALGIKATTLNAKIKRYGIDLVTPAEESEVETS